MIRPRVCAWSASAEGMVRPGPSGPPHLYNGCGYLPCQGGMSRAWHTAGVQWVLLALTLTTVVPTERLLNPARGPPVPFHSVARARRPLPCHGAAGLHSASEGFHSPGCWPHCHPLQVGALGIPRRAARVWGAGLDWAGSRSLKRTRLGFSLLGDRG